MKDLETLNTLQTNYQAKFAQLLQLQEQLGLTGTEASDSVAYNSAKAEWVEAGNNLKLHLELMTK